MAGEHQVALLGRVPLPLLLVISLWHFAPEPDSPTPVVPSPLAEPAAGALRPIEGRAPRVLVLGDSIADQQGSHAAFALREAGVDVRVTARWGSGLFTREQYDYGSTQPAPPPDSLLALATEAVLHFNPDVVAVYSNHNYWPPYPRDPVGQEIGLGSPEFAAMAQAQLRALVTRLTQNGAKVYLVEPFAFEGITVAQNPIWASYLTLQEELGFGVIHAGRVLTTSDGQPHVELADCAGQPAAVTLADGHLSYFGAGLMGTVTARALAEILDVRLSDPVAPAEPPVALLPSAMGYHVLTCDGATFGGAPTHLQRRPRPGDPVVAATTTVFGRQGWAVTRAGVALPFGDAPDLGNAVTFAKSQPVVGIAAAPLAQGYWVARRNGVVRAYGAAAVLGDLAGQGEDVVAMASTPDRRGYWLLAASGRVEGFGSAALFGDLRAAPPSEQLVGIAAHPSGRGYWLLDRAGDVYPFGVAGDFGSAANQDLISFLGLQGEDFLDAETVAASEAPTQAVALLPTLSGNGYWVALANGAVCHFGDARTLGGIHVGEIEALQVFLGTPLYGEGACSQRDDAGIAAGPPGRLALLG